MTEQICAKCVELAAKVEEGGELLGQLHEENKSLRAEVERLQTLEKNKVKDVLNAFYRMDGFTNHESFKQVWDSKKSLAYAKKLETIADSETHQAPGLIAFWHSLDQTNRALYSAHLNTYIQEVYYSAGIKKPAAKKAKMEESDDDDEEEEVL